MKSNFPISLGIFLSLIWLVWNVNGQHPGHLVVDVLPLDQSSKEIDQDCKILGNGNAVCSPDGITSDDNDSNLENFAVSESDDEEEDPTLLDDEEDTGDEEDPIDDEEEDPNPTGN